MNALPFEGIDSFSASFESGEITGFYGSNVEGREKLLSVAGLIEKPDSGRLFLFEQGVSEMPSAMAAKARDTTFGYLFTHPHLLPTFTAAENVAMPYLRICGGIEVQDRTIAALEFTGIRNVHGIPVGDLPDAVHWRIAFARAIVHSPAVLIAVTPPNPVLLPMARRLADEFGTTVLWNGEKASLLPFANKFVEINAVSLRTPGI